VTNDATVAARAHVRNLRGGLEIFVAFLTPVGTNVVYDVRTVHRRDGTVVARLGRSGVKLDCPVRARWRLARDVVWLSFSQSCLREHRALRVYAAIGAGNGRAGDPADWTRTVRVARN
jgi:hypothetical protein